MRPGPARGTTVSRELVVDSTMTDSGSAIGLPAPLPPIFGMLAMAETIASMAQDLLTEHLEDGEILIPGRIEIIQRAPVPVGASVLLEATVQMVEPTRVSIEVLVRTAAGVSARGSYEQEVMERSAWLDRVGTTTV
jgi:predicted thioesterase